MIKIYYKKINDKKLQEIDKFLVGSWMCVNDPTEEEINFLNKKFFLDKDLIEDALDPFEVPRVELSDGIIYIFTRIPAREENGKIITVPILIAVGNNFVTTITSHKLSLLSSFLKRDDDSKKDNDFSTTQKTKLVLQIFLAIDQEYSKFFAEINKEIKNIGLNLESIKNKNVIQFVSFEEILGDFINSLVPTNSSFKNMLSGRFLNLYEEDKDLIENLLLDNEQLIATCETNLKNIINMRKACSTIMTNNLNKSIELLTLVAALIAIPTLITSFYGMNVHLPFAEYKETSLYIIGVSIIASCPILFFFLKK
ncbi:MAG: magnesium transporter CorA family protein [Patescibacteria group bacterium]|nr:magnesium transporter CorA family protein [Patescibacteria group bacterium]MBU0880333.1 magnesium transporter CorA family protein [Patescibacteria group bacterium]MBU0897590.1 magnesium transporter CorA family protein [Patescibacteria group bacterium]MBU1063170.1 magnesium transporter CorA family protein [Patescibacteria group bacterium]MBU1783065.1 magnesium transporter CorA family protein [Patescibacteria group bacterium]